MDLTEQLRFHQEHKIADKLKKCARSLLYLALFRLILLEFFWLFSDLCTALVVYFTYTNRTSLMAIFCLVNGIIGLIYSIAKGVSDMYFIIHYVNSTLFAIFLIFMFIFSVILYLAIILFSYLGYKTFRSGFDQQPRNNYNAQGNSGNQENDNVRGFVAFGGAGRTVGTNINR